MRAWIYRQFGSPDVLQLENAPEPAAPADGVVVALKASSLNVLDTRSRRGLMFPFVNRKFPKTPGIDVAGVVVAVGSEARRFKVGDSVFGAGSAFKGGALAERVALPERVLARLPEGLDFETAATLPTTGLAAVLAVRELGGVGPGSRVLIHGGSGAAGLVATAVAKRLGAQVVSIGGAAGVQPALDAGADLSLDYKQKPLDLGAPYDLIVNFSGAMPYKLARPHLKPRGRFVEASPTIPKFLGSLIVNPFRARKHLMLQTSANTAALEELGGWIARGEVASRVARAYAFEEARTAYADFEKGGVLGKMVVRGPAAD